MEHISNYMGSIFNYIGQNLKEQAYISAFGFFHPDFWCIASFFSLDYSNNDPIRTCDFDRAAVLSLTGVQVVRHATGKKG